MQPGSMHALYYGRHRLSLRAGTYLALVRMMGVAHLVTALYGHSQLASQTAERLSRTRRTLLDLIVHGFDAPPGRAAVARLRAVHAHLPADAADFRYVLGTFFLEPLRWNAAHARVKLDEGEAAMLLAFWNRVGAEMAIPDLPATLDAWRREQAAYEARCLRPTPEGARLAALCLRDVVKLTVPAALRGPFRQLMLATMEDRVREVLALPRASAAARWAVRWMRGRRTAA